MGRVARVSALLSLWLITGNQTRRENGRGIEPNNHCKSFDACRLWLATRDKHVVEIEDRFTQQAEIIGGGGC